MFIPSNEYIGKRIQHVMVDHDLTTADLMLLWRLTQHSVKRILTGRVECRIRYMRALSERTGVEMARFLE